MKCRQIGACAPLMIFAFAGCPAQAQTQTQQPAQTATQTPAQQSSDTAQTLKTVIVYGAVEQDTSAVKAQYPPGSAQLGPLGQQPIQTAPQSVTVIPQDLIINQQAQTVNDTLRYLPSVEIRDQQGFEVSRPQSRGFEGSVVQNTRIDGLNAIGTTAMPAENLSSVEVLNGLAGSLYGPETPAGVFDYVLKRPTAAPLLRFDESYDSESIFTEHLDAGGSAGPVAVRVNAVRGDGEGYTPGSSIQRTMFTGAVDFHIDDQTVLQTNYSYYDTNGTGLPGSIVYDGGKSTLLPPAIDPTRIGYGQPDAGPNLRSNLGLITLIHRFNDNWSLQIGGLYESAVRNLLGITDTLTDNKGDFTVTKNFNAVPNFTIGSNSAYLNGQVDWLGMRNDVTFGTNGFVNDQYSYRKSIAVVLGSASLADPVVFTPKPTPAGGGEYGSGRLTNQSIIAGDTMHFDQQLALQAVLSSSFLSSHSYAASGKVTSASIVNDALSPTVSLIYQPVTPLVTYATFARSVEQGDEASAGTANANEYLAPYKDYQYEVGAKYSPTTKLLLTVDGFDMTRPLAATNASTNVFEVVGTQRNLGAEVFAQGQITSYLSLLGGVTYIDARLIGTGNPLTNDKLVVGVPDFKGDVVLDYHPAFAHGLALTGALHGEGARAATNTNYSFAPSYATVDLGARYAHGIGTHLMTVRFQVLNATDTRYFSSVADGNIAGSPGANTAYSGTPRTYEANLAFDL